MRSNFLSAISNLREWEGFASDDPDDPGGATVFGIARAYHPDIPWPPTWEQAQKIYLVEYWIRGGCDALPFPMDMLHFDSCVNPGIGAAIRFLHDTGEHTDPYRRAVEYIDLRLRYYLNAVHKSPVKLKYLRGWTSRSLDFLERQILTHWALDETKGGGR